VKTRRPRLALPYTVLADRDRVRLVAGEDCRYTLTGPGLEQWLPDFLSICDGRLSLDECLGRLPSEHRPAARELAERLYGERLLCDGPAAAAHRPAPYRLAVEGTGPLAESLRQQLAADNPDAPPLPVLVQDRLDYEEALAFNRRCLGGATPWFWVTSGPLQRGYVSPAFRPDAGPCLACLLSHFRWLSPAPEIYDALAAHRRGGGAISPVPFPDEGLAVLRGLLLWKVALLAEPAAPAALFRLHVLEVADLEVSGHRVFVDPECPDCGGGR
jgi:bacteriocin biosynthesis cyclodehydratase domain-containing protein